MAENIKIDKDGFLSILRGKEWKECYCPFHTPKESGAVDPQQYCGDWCPLFGSLRDPSGGVWGKSAVKYLQLCKREIPCSSIEDERK